MGIGIPQKKEEKFKWALGSAAALLIVVLVLLVKWWDDLAALSAVFGAALGWAAGTLSSPYGKKEQHQFGSFGKVVSAFATGFLLSKIDRVFDLAISEKYQPLLFDERFIRRLLVGATCFLIAMMVVFIARQYYPIEVPDSTAKRD